MKVLVACLPDPSSNPRPRRAIWLLAQMKCQIWVLSGAQRIDNPTIKCHLPVYITGGSLHEKVRRKILYWLSVFFGLIPGIDKFSSLFYWRAINAHLHSEIIQSGLYDLILVEDLPLLPRIISLSPSTTKVVFDAREYAPREFEASLLFKLFDKERYTQMLRRHLHEVNGFYTVCDSLAIEFFSQFKRKPKVIRSLPFYTNDFSSPVACYPIRMVHHGIANADRGLWHMVDVIKALSGMYTLDLYLVGDKNHIKLLSSRAGNCPWIRFMPPVKFDSLNNMLCSYDLGFYLLQPSGFNTKFALPNKLFEFIQAGLGVIIGPSPEMKSLVEKYSCGLASINYSSESMVELLTSLCIQDIIMMKDASRRAAVELCWEKESKLLKSLIESVVCLER